MLPGARVGFFRWQSSVSRNFFAGLFFQGGDISQVPKKLGMASPWGVAKAMNSKPDSQVVRLTSMRDEKLSAELHRFDPYDVIGYAALTATLVNIAASTSGPFPGDETLLSVSLVGGFLSYCNWEGVPSKAAIVLTLLHVLFLQVLSVL